MITEKLQKVDDLRWVQLEQLMNTYLFGRGVKTRLRCMPINEYVTKVCLLNRGAEHVIAIYLKDENELMRLDGSLTLQWMYVCSAFREVYEGIKII